MSNCDLCGKPCGADNFSEEAGLFICDDCMEQMAEQKPPKDYLACQGVLYRKGSPGWLVMPPSLARDLLARHYDAASAGDWRSPTEARMAAELETAIRSAERFASTREAA